MRQPTAGASSNPPEGPASQVSAILRGLRQAAGITQDGWAAHLGYGRRTIQRWEGGLQAPDSEAAVAIGELAERLGLLRTFQQGPLAGLSLDAAGLAALLADARLAHVAVPEPTDNLPADLAPLIGREWEVAELARLASSVRFVTVTGMGGVGKTRLALEVAHELRGSWPDGVWLVELADVVEPAFVPLAVMRALRARELPGSASSEAVLRSLRDRQMLLVLDNCEQVRDAVALLVADVLRQCPGLRVLATSRDRLGVPGEIVWPLAPLITPAEDADADLEEVARSDAVRMFVAVARAARSDFSLTTHNAADVARIARRLDGLPLAIELAAARLAVVTAAELDARLGESFELLATTNATMPSRQRTLAATLDWSWGLLPDSERELLARLSVFVDGCGLPAIAAVCRPDALLADLGRLVDRSLVNARTEVGGRETRYRLLDTVRTYARDRLEEQGESSEIAHRLARWCLETARVAGAAIHGPDQARWYRWIESEHGTIRAVMRRALDQGEADLALGLIAALWWPWGVLGLATEAQAWTEQALLLSDARRPSRPLVATLLAAGAFASFAGSRIAADTRLGEADVIARQLEDPELRLAVLAQRARLLQMTGNFDEAMLLANEGLDLADPNRDGWVAARLLEMKAHAALRAGQSDTARTALDDALAIARINGDTWSSATTLGELGDLARSTGRHAEAAAHYRASLALRQSLGIPGSTPSLQQNLGFLALASGHRRRATEEFTQALAEFRRTGDVRGVAECVIGFAGLASLAGAPASSGRLIGWAESSLQAAGAVVWPSTGTDLARIIGAGREALGLTEWEAARAAGAELTFEEIRQFVQQDAPRRRSRDPAPRTRRRTAIAPARNPYNPMRG